MTIEQKTEIAGIYKVSEGVLINKDDNALQAYKKRKLKAQQIDNVTNDIIDLKRDMEEIKMLLRGLVK
jgi:hypothetical protein